MQPSVPPRILLCGPREDDAADVRRALEHGGHAVRWHAETNGNLDSLASYRLIVLDSPHGHGTSTALCHQLRTALGDEFVPILLVTDDRSPAARLAALDSGADTCLQRPFTSDELLAQATALLRIKDRHDRLADKAAEFHRINRQLQQAYQQIDQELELARRIQRSLLPQVMPEVPRMRFAIHYRLCGQVGGDFYDVFRLDEDHVGLYVADAVGHGVPASLLTIYVKKGMRSKEIYGKHYRLLPPDEVLQRLNRDMIDQALSEHPFITMVYALLNFKENTLSFARAGHPYPLHVPRGAAPQMLQVHGSLLGVFDTKFPVATHQLRPGDKVLFYSDGVDSASLDGRAPGAPSLVACVERHRGLGIQEFVDRVAHDLFTQKNQPDDLTLLGLEVSG